MRNQKTTYATGALLGAAVALSLGCNSASEGPKPEAPPGSSASPPSAAPAEVSSPAGAGQAAVGKPAPDFTVTDMDGNKHTLSAYKGKVVVLEWFNPDCPFVRKNHTEGSLKGMAKGYRDKGVVWLAINSGAPGKQGHGVETNTKGREAYGIDYPIAFDEAGEVGRLYGAATTPHMFVIDAQGVLVYAGGIDNEPQADPADGVELVNYVAAALDDVAAGRPVKTASSEPYGCSVKYAK